MYVCIQLKHTKTVTCYKTDPSSRKGGSHKTDKTTNVLTKEEIWWS